MQAKFVIETLRHSLMANIVAEISSTRFGSSRQCRRRHARRRHRLPRHSSPLRLRLPAFARPSLLPAASYLTKSSSSQSDMSPR